MIENGAIFCYHANMDIELESKLEYYSGASYFFGEFLRDLIIIDHTYHTNISKYYYHSASSLGIILGISDFGRLEFKELMREMLESELSIDDINSIYKGMLEL